MLAPQSPGTERDNTGGVAGREREMEVERDGERVKWEGRLVVCTTAKAEGEEGRRGEWRRWGEEQDRKERPIKSLRSIHGANLFNLIFKRAKTNDF